MVGRLTLTLAGGLSLALAVLACGPGELTTSRAQELLDEQLGPDVAEVVGVQQVNDQEAIARIRIGGTEGGEVDVTFSLFDTGWRTGEVEMMGQSFPLAQLVGAADRGRQRRTMADMRNIATANGTRRVDTGGYASSLDQLAPVYMETVPMNDAWDNPFVYEATDDGGYRLTSLGSDGRPGPAPPAAWPNAPYEPDIILRNGLFVQAPTGQ